MRILAITNIKGGVGKTTTAANLSFLSAAGGHPTIMWDLDPQGAATYTLRCEAGETASARKLVSGKKELPELVVHTAHDGLDLLPSDFSYRTFDVHLAQRKHPTERLLRMSRSLGERYDTLFLDCPAGISLLSENVLRAADAVIVPLIPTPLSVRMLAQLRDFLAESGWDDVALLPFFSMVDRRRAMHQEIVENGRKEFPELLETEVPYSSEIERMSLRRAPIASYAPSSAAAQVYSELWREIERRLRRASSRRARPAKAAGSDAAGAEQSSAAHATSRNR
jgi:chromosome partitioning protein